VAQEVQDAAMSLGISIPESVRLPEMPTLDAPIKACLLMGRPSRRRLKWIQDHLFVSDSGESGSNS
jgi:hypothetical protein